MERPEHYRTKQREAILRYIASLDGAHVTAAQIEKHFSKFMPISRATIYRHLERFTQGGELRKYLTDGVSGACYQYTGEEHGDHAHLHLKCEGCGELLHMECGTLAELTRHIHNAHAFEVNAAKTVLYGRCLECLGGASALPAHE